MILYCLEGALQMEAVCLTLTMFFAVNQGTVLIPTTTLQQK